MWEKCLIKFNFLTLHSPLFSLSSYHLLITSFTSSVSPSSGSLPLYAFHAAISLNILSMQLLFSQSSAFSNSTYSSLFCSLNLPLFLFSSLSIFLIPPLSIFDVPQISRVLSHILSLSFWNTSFAFTTSYYSVVFLFCISFVRCLIK